MIRDDDAIIYGARSFGLRLLHEFAYFPGGIFKADSRLRATSSDAYRDLNKLNRINIEMKAIIYGVVVNIQFSITENSIFSREQLVCQIQGAVSRSLVTGLSEEVANSIRPSGHETQEHSASSLFVGEWLNLDELVCLLEIRNT